MATTADYNKQDAKSMLETARDVKPSKILSGNSFIFCGKLCTTHAELSKIVFKHGGLTFPGGCAKYVVSSIPEFQKASYSVVSAVNAGSEFVVNEMFLYKAIVDQKFPKVKDYSFINTEKEDKEKEKEKEKKEKEEKKRKEEEKKKDFVVEAIPIGDSIYSGGGGESDDEEDDASVLPECKYGEGCYRKNAEHFKQFSHPWLVG
eukprot:TRINITY_DN1113_c0_g1_i1.p2 TRINITY_DN1113_c0_g1~~TRINITY_DN1113_c0_g1_i1.p2  ORF type:complete len:204 (+),score=57.89 TRINITY_DN1113_c0_g1_i1:1288-1899(+)